MLEPIPAAHASIRPLFRDLEHHLLVEAFFEGKLPANLFVDDTERPRAGLLAYNNRFLFGGDPNRADFNAALHHYFTEKVIPLRKAAGSDGILLYYSPADWLPRLDEVFSGFETFQAPREYYQMTTPDPAPDIDLPAGFSLHLISPAFMESGIQGLEALREEMCSERTSVEDFLAHSFGICPVYENEIAGWCLSEYNTGGGCEIGIATLEPHQRQGLATQLTKAFLAEAARRGYTRIGWDCWKRNQPSAATARKAGFTLLEEYPAFVALF
jgi:GNAT superfamily N-acetyltransferase